MNNNFLKVIVLLCLVMTACSTDDEPVIPTSNLPDVDSQLIVEGDTYTLSQGYIESYGENDNGSYDWDITFATEGLQFDTEEAPITGEGTLVYLDLNTDSITGLSEGTYTFSEEREAFTWINIDVITNYDSATETGQLYAATDGELIVEGYGDNRTYTVNVTTDTEAEINVIFQGELVIVE